MAGTLASKLEDMDMPGSPATKVAAMSTAAVNNPMGRSPTAADSNHMAAGVSSSHMVVASSRAMESASSRMGPRNSPTVADRPPTAAANSKDTESRSKAMDYSSKHMAIEMNRMGVSSSRMEASPMVDNNRTKAATRMDVSSSQAMALADMARGGMMMRARATAAVGTRRVGMVEGSAVGGTSGGVLLLTEHAAKRGQ